MSLPIRLISTDFDGTLHTEAETPRVPTELQELIAHLQSRGAKWVINTGRDFPSLMEALSAANLSVQPDFLVVVEREIHCRNGSGFDSLDPWNRACTLDHEEIFARVRSDMPRLTRWIQSRFSATTIYEDPYSPFCLIAESNHAADQILLYMQEYCSGVPKLTIMRNDIYARFSHEKYHKGSALGEISRQLGLGPQHVFAAGDHFNDLPMLSTEYATWLVAPENAIDAVKESVRRQKGHVSSNRYGKGVFSGLQFFLNQSLS